MQFSAFFKKNQFSYFVYVFSLVGAGILFSISKGDVVFFINGFANNQFDFVFRGVTELGNGLMYIFVGLIVLFFSYKKAAQVYMVGIMLLVVSFVCKQFVFPGFHRPTACFPLDMFSHIIPNFSYAKKFSFPSGHSMTIFGITTFFAFYATKPYVRILLFFIACAVGFSRMYLLQHFFMDVYTGAILGYFMAVLGIYISHSFFSIPEKGIKDLL